MLLPALLDHDLQSLIDGRFISLQCALDAFTRTLDKNREALGEPFYQHATEQAAQIQAAFDSIGCSRCRGETMNCGNNLREPVGGGFVEAVCGECA